MSFPDQPSDLVVQVQLSKSDILRSTLLYLAKKPWIWIMPIFVGAGVYNGLSSVPFGGVFALIAAVSVLVLIPYSSFRASAKQPGILAPITYTFSDHEIDAKFESAAVRAAWSLTTGAWETRQFVYIGMQRSSYHLIPKRQITQKQLSDLRQVLRSHITGKVRLHA